ncbi:MAG: MurR/RpiR family transcriptional regulator [Clostridia bacterium]|nr:MurR/RpiR family transcriptional regulator [Clostridia bacterium]
MLIDVDRAVWERLTRAEQDIIRFINDNEAQLPELSIVDIAMETYTSPASVSRAIRKCGITGFHELRYKTTVVADKPEICQMGEVVNSSLLEVQRLVDRLSVPVVLGIVESIREADRILALGLGLSEYVTAEFALKLQLLDHNAVALTDPNLIRTRTKRMKPSELVLIFSLNGRTPELIEAAQNANQCGAKVITCCCDAGSPLLQMSDHVIVGHREHHSEIVGYEVDSRLPLHVISRILVEYLVAN